MQLVMVVSKEDTERAVKHIELLETYLPVDKIIIIGNKETGELVEKSGKSIAFLNEDSVYQNLNYKRVGTAIKERGGREGRTGWYFQQFLKMAYAFCTTEEYYLVWDGDTVPIRKIELFDEAGKPYLALKEEYNEAYFVTMERLLGFKKIREESFISEHMLIGSGYMREMIQEIEENKALKGDSFFEKILSAVGDEMLSGSGFSEYETYGTYMLQKHPNVYHCIPYTSCRHTISMIGYHPNQEQMHWMAQKYEAISFEKWDSPIKGLTKFSEKEWFRRWIGLERYDKICFFRCRMKFSYGYHKRLVGRKIKKILRLT